MLTSCQKQVSRGNPWGMVTNENSAGQRKQLGHKFVQLWCDTITGLGRREKSAGTL